MSRLVEAGILFQGGYNVLGFYGLSNYFHRNGDEYKLLLQQSRPVQPAEMGFIKFTGGGEDITIELDFVAIGKY